MVLTFIDHADGAPNEASLQTLTLARNLAHQLGTNLHAVATGSGAERVGEAVASYGVATVHHVADERLETYAPEAWGSSVAQVASANGPEAVLAPGTERGQEVLAHAAAELDQPMAANCIEVTPGEPFQVVRHQWGSSLLEEARLKGDPPMLSVPPHALSAQAADAPGEAQVQTFEPTIEDRHLRVRVTDVETTDTEGVSLKEAEVVIGGGRGVGGEDGFEILEELARELGGAVGGSRVATNNGWRPHDDQIGLTGNKIAPQIYIACGISGAVQHMVGCKGAKHVLAINTDDESTMVQKADWAVLGDLHEIIPAITEEVRKAKS
ncbi:MAG: electron transfer flavoprotein subunit alpha/FixB family protein [Candidatus Bipolaricaulia bacterium]